MPMKTNVETAMTAVTAQYQSDPWVVMLMSDMPVYRPPSGLACKASLVLFCTPMVSNARRMSIDELIGVQVRRDAIQKRDVQRAMGCW